MLRSSHIFSWILELVGTFEDVRPVEDATCGKIGSKFGVNAPTIDQLSAMTVEGRRRGMGEASVAAEQLSSCHLAMMAVHR